MLTCPCPMACHQITVATRADVAPPGGPPPDHGGRAGAGMPTWWPPPARGRGRAGADVPPDQVHGLVWPCRVLAGQPVPVACMLVCLPVGRWPCPCAGAQPVPWCACPSRHALNFQGMLTMLRSLNGGRISVQIDSEANASVTRGKARIFRPTRNMARFVVCPGGLSFHH